MNSEDYPRTDIVREIPPCGSLGGKDINEIPKDQLEFTLTVAKAQLLKKTLEDLVGSCMLHRQPERQNGVAAIHMINEAIAKSVQFVSPPRTIADAYDEIEEARNGDEENMLPDPDLPLDIKVTKLPNTDDVDIDETEEQFFEWLYDLLCSRTDEPDHYSMRATNVCDGIFGTIEWVLSPASAEKGNYEDLQVYLNGKPLYLEGISRREVLALLCGLGIHETNKEKD